MARIEKNSAESLAARVEALSPRRLSILTGLFILALTALLAGKLNEEGRARQIETELRVIQAVNDGSSAMNIAIMTGASTRVALAEAWPGGLAVLYHLSPSSDVLAAYGATEVINLDAVSLRALPLNARAERRIDLASGEITAAWRPLDNGEVLLAAAPARDMFARTPIWIGYGLILAAITLVTASLMAAFIRQSRAAAEAAGAVATLGDFDEALAGGRCCPWFYDSKMRMIRFSRAFLEPLGLGARDRYFTMREISALLHPQDLRTAVAIFTGDAAGTNEGVVRMREPSGGWSRVFLRTSSNATRFERAGVAIDLAGSRMIAPAAAIAESRLRDAIESIPEAFVLWDAHGRLAVCNRRFASIFRLSPQDLKPGLKAADIAKRARIGAEIVTTYFAPEAALNQQSVEVELPGNRWTHISRRRTAEGGMVCIATNVTDLKRRARAQKKKERELERIVDDLVRSRKELSDTMHNYELEKYRAEEASRSKSEFLANMSHELRTPLNAINGFSEIMQSELYGPLGDEKYKEYVSDILSSGRHLLELIDDILDMSKIEAGRMKLEPKRVELERILRESTRLVSKRAADAGVKLTASVGHAPPVWADARAVKQVTLNLLSNAIKFTPEGGEVTLTAEADLDGVTVIIADNGTGIEKEQLEKIGAPFELVEDHFSKSRKGSGLGLALSKSLMELQNGLLAIASRPDKGTVACATFPRRKGAKVRLPQFIRHEARILTGELDGVSSPSELKIASPKAAE